MSITDALTRVLRPENTAYTRCLTTVADAQERDTTDGR